MGELSLRNSANLLNKFAIIRSLSPTYFTFDLERERRISKRRRRGKHKRGEINCLPKTQLLANMKNGCIRSESCPVIVS